MAQEAHRYELKSGYIKLVLNGSSVGTRELWWDDYGNISREVEKSKSTTKRFGISSMTETHTLLIINGEKYWSVNYINNYATTGTIQGYKKNKYTVTSKAEGEQEEITMGSSTHKEEKDSTELIDGYKCEVIKMLGAKTWVYKGLTLKTEGTVMGIKINDSIDKFEPEVIIAASQFIPPNEYKYVDISQNRNQMYQLVENTETDSPPQLNYPFEKFKRCTSTLKCKNHTYTVSNNIKNTYTSTYMKSTNSFITITAESMKNSTLENTPELIQCEKLKINGHKAYYTSEIGDTLNRKNELIIEYPKQRMCVMITCPNTIRQQELMEFAKQIKL